jgi:hypothetical protein
MCCAAYVSCSGCGCCAGIVDTGSPHAARLHRQSMQSSYLKDPEQLPFELNMLEVALGEVRGPRRSGYCEGWRRRMGGGAQGVVCYVLKGWSIASQAQSGM